MDKFDRDAMLLHENVVTRSGRTVIRQTRLDLECWLVVVLGLLLSVFIEWH